ncbi:hypothetical protein HPULCUR_008808 [Helicostylum pulchrum]|uniref:Uncharacterized protein n=1 Tax=Helicostylum pulchrum TaxID=562976 RepID=A0ABP9Y8M0_9FUNG
MKEPLLDVKMLSITGAFDYLTDPKFAKSYNRPVNTTEKRESTSDSEEFEGYSCHVALENLDFLGAYDSTIAIRAKRSCSAGYCSDDEYKDYKENQYDEYKDASL